MQSFSACSFIFVQISHFHKNGFALRLALKERHKGTLKWPILLMNESVVQNKFSHLSDKFELESVCLQEKMTDCVSVMKVECPDQRSL